MSYPFTSKLPSARIAGTGGNRRESESDSESDSGGVTDEHDWRSPDLRGAKQLLCHSYKLLHLFVVQRNDTYRTVKNSDITSSGSDPA